MLSLGIDGSFCAFFFFFTLHYFLPIISHFLSEKMQSTSNSFSLFLYRSSIVYEDWLNLILRTPMTNCPNLFTIILKNKTICTILNWKTPWIFIHFMFLSGLYSYHTNQVSADLDKNGEILTINNFGQSGMFKLHRIFIFLLRETNFSKSQFFSWCWWIIKF